MRPSPLRIVDRPTPQFHCKPVVRSAKLTEEVPSDENPQRGIDAGDHITAYAPAGISKTVHFDRILPNPPIWSRPQALHQLLEDRLNRLNPEGRAHLPAQKHLGSDSLSRWLTDQGFPTTRPAAPAIAYSKLTLYVFER